MIQRNLSGKVDEEVRRTIVDLDSRLSQMEQLLVAIKANGNGGGLTRQQQADVAGLIGALGQGLIGSTATDPLLGSVGTGTLSSLSASTTVAGLSISVTNPTTAPAISLTGTPNIAASNVTSGQLDTARLPNTINIATAFQIAGAQVVNARKTGWGSPSGTLSRAAYAAYAGQSVSVGYVQAEAQATDDALKLLARVVAALLTDLHFATSGHGLIGA
jgi:hypothetical protein